MRKLTWLTLLLAATLQAGCQRAPKEQGMNGGPDMVAAPSELQSAPAAEATAVEAPTPAQPAPGAPKALAATGRLLVYHAEIRLKTEAMPRAAARLDSLVRRYSGFVSAATETRADGEWRQETTIRVPPAQFQHLLGGLSGLGTIEEKKLNTDDMTAEHADVAARLAAKRAIEHQYTTLLGRAQRIKDVLDIEAKLGEVREEIEATESRLKALNDQVAYSTITLTLYQPLVLALPDAPVVSFSSRLVESFYDGWQLLVVLLLGSISLWPVLLLSVAGSWWWLRRRARPRQPAMPAAS